MDNILTFFSLAVLTVGRMFFSGGEYGIHVNRVIDGDTIVIEGTDTVRYVGVDTPELSHSKNKTSQCYASEAAHFNESLLKSGKWIMLEKDVSWRDRYGRLLRYVYVVDDKGKRTLINERLVREGYASLLLIAPDVHRAPQLAIAQLYAMLERKGMWSACP